MTNCSLSSFDFQTGGVSAEEKLKLLEREIDCEHPPFVVVVDTSALLMIPNCIDKLIKCE